MLLVTKKSQYINSFHFEMANMKVDTYLIFKSFSVPYYYSILFGWMPIRIPKNENDKVGI